MRIICSWILFAFTLPWSLVAWGLGALTMLLGLTRPQSLKWVGAGILTLEWRPWFAKRFKYSTTIGRIILFQPGARRGPAELDDQLERHERVHVRQVEDLMVLSALVGASVWLCTGDALLGLALWASGGLWQAPGWFTAVMRYGFGSPRADGKLIKRIFDVAYRDSEHERSAYAQSDAWPGGGSWWERRDKER
jgi:hypothetical protein